MFIHEPTTKVNPHAMHACGTVPTGGRAGGRGRRRVQGGNQAGSKLVKSQAHECVDTGSKRWLPFACNSDFGRREAERLPFLVCLCVCACTRYAYYGVKSGPYLAGADVFHVRLCVSQPRFSRAVHKAIQTFLSNLRLARSVRLPAPLQIASCSSR